MVGETSYWCAKYFHVCFRIFSSEPQQLDCFNDWIQVQLMGRHGSDWNSSLRLNKLTHLLFDKCQIDVNLHCHCPNQECVVCVLESLHPNHPCHQIKPHQIPRSPYHKRCTEWHTQKDYLGSNVCILLIPKDKEYILFVTHSHHIMPNYKKFLL